MTNPATLFKPDKSKLGTLIAGTSGSGKTTAVVSMLRNAYFDPKFGEFHRFIIIDPKVQVGDYDLLVDPVNDINSTLKSIEENRMTLYWPDYPEFDQKTLDSDVGEIVNFLFNLHSSNPKMTATVVLDEASILISPNQISQSLKRLTVQGRAKGILPVYISQRPLTNRWIDANISRVILFKMLPVDTDNLTKRWGVDFTKVSDRLTEKPFSWVIFDLGKVTTRMMNPVHLPQRIKREKKSFWKSVVDSFWR